MSITDITQWIAFAGGDLKSAKCGLKDSFPAYHTICFLAQLSSEKYIKALLLYKGWKLVKQHDLIYLANILKKDYKINIDAIKESVIILNNCIVEARYPSDIDVNLFTQELAEEAVEAAETVSDFVVEKIKGDKSC